MDEFFEWSKGWLGVAAFAVSLAALFLSWLAYRQRVRYHPQPKLVMKWRDSLEPASGLFIRQGHLWNFGDAPARDLRLDVEHADVEAGEAWQERKLLEPDQSWEIRVPVVDGVSRNRGAYGINYERHRSPESYRMVTPRVVVRWRQAPYKRRKLNGLVVTPPRTPDLMVGES